MIYVNWEKSSKVDFDDSIQFGRAVFETILIREKPVFLMEHIERLNKSSKKLSINNFLDIDEIKEFIKKENIKNCALKVILSDKNIILTTRSLTYNEGTYKNGFKVRLSKVIRNSTSIMPYIKSTNYIENILEREEALKNNFNEVVFMNENKLLTEGSISNIYIVKDSIIKTPKVTCGLLDGTLRKWIISNFEVEQGEYNIEDIINSDGIFLTNSLVGVIRVSEFNGKKFGEHILIEKISKKYFEFLEGF